mmetsp:Transcript_54480/g.156637  ORF Transcript_54480/g.156637 Transcript_54480/m.156637 type:complete len:226 (+) Transcript_54480:325-1002(+)
MTPLHLSPHPKWHRGGRAARCRTGNESPRRGLWGGYSDRSRVLHCSRPWSCRLCPARGCCRRPTHWGGGSDVDRRHGPYGHRSRRDLPHRWSSNNHLQPVRRQDIPPLKLAWTPEVGDNLPSGLGPQAHHARGLIDVDKSQLALQPVALDVHDTSDGAAGLVGFVKPDRTLRSPADGVLAGLCILPSSQDLVNQHGNCLATAGSVGDPPGRRGGRAAGCRALHRG